MRDFRAITFAVIGLAIYQLSLLALHAEGMNGWVAASLASVISIATVFAILKVWRLIRQRTDR